MTQDELNLLSNIEIFKIQGSPSQKGFIFSVENQDPQSEETFKYYIVSTNIIGTPSIKKLNNTIALITSGALKLNKVEKDTNEMNEFVELITAIEQDKPTIGTPAPCPVLARK